MQQDICCTGWTGKACDEPVCNVTCEHGECVAPNTCRCETGYAGEGCQYLQSLFTFVLL